MKTKLGEINITSTSIQIIDLNWMDFFHEDVNEKSNSDTYGIIELDEYNVFYAAHLENKTYNIYGKASKNQFKDWDELSIEIQNKEVFSSQEIGELYIDSGSVLIGDFEVNTNWNTKSVDGKANVICWGSHAPKIADKLDLKKRGNTYGWFDVPLEKTDEYLKKIKKKKRFWYGLESLWEPHSHKNILKGNIEEAENNLSSLTIGKNKLLGIGIHQDGAWPVYIDFSKEGDLCNIRILLE